MGVYTHIGLHDQQMAIELLPSPPELRPSGKTPPSTAQAGGNGAQTNPANDQILDNRQLDALWAQLPEHVKSRLLATAKAGPASDQVAGQGG
jgi:hypothetical protein